jgi:Family of unknown function (DUF6263)
MLRHALLGLAVLAVCAATPVYGQEVKLQLKFKEGEKFWVEEVATMKQDITVMGQQQKIEATTTTITSYTVKKVTPDDVVLAMKIEDVNVKSEGGFGGALDQVSAKTKGATLNLTLANDGKVKKVDGLQDFIKQLSGDDEAAKMMKELMNEEMFTKGFENSFGFVPDKPVKKGDSWKRETKFSLGPLGGFKLNNNYVYTGPKSGGDGIDSKFNMEWLPAKGDALGGLFKVVGSDMKGEGTASYVFDQQKGRPASSTTAMKMGGNLKIEAGGMELQMSLTMDMSGTSKILDQNPLKK